MGDGEAEEGAIASAWSMSRIMNPATDGIVLPVVHMNGYKITTPSMLAAASVGEREAYFRGLGYDPVTFTDGFDDEDPLSFHARMAELMEAGALRPALVIGVPVGFVNVVESKERIWEVCRRMGVPAIAAMGRKGGSTVAAAVCNALLYQAAGMRK